MRAESQHTSWLLFFPQARQARQARQASGASGSSGASGLRRVRLVRRLKYNLIFCFFIHFCPQSLQNCRVLIEIGIFSLCLIGPDQCSPNCRILTLICHHFTQFSTNPSKITGFWSKLANFHCASLDMTGVCPHCRIFIHFSQNNSLSPQIPPKLPDFYSFLPKQQSFSPNPSKIAGFLFISPRTTVFLPQSLQNCRILIWIGIFSLCFIGHHLCLS